MHKQKPTKVDSALLIRDRMYGERKSSLAKYRELVLGEASLFALLRYEFVTGLFGPMPGALGLAARQVLYRSLFKQIGRGVVFGRNVVIRHPNRIRLGNRVVIDDYALLDARGGGDEGIEIGDDTLIHRGSIVQAKVGPVRIGSETNIGAGSVIVSLGGGTYIGNRVGIGGGCYISGGVFGIDRETGSARDQQKYTRGPVQLDDKVWLGMRATVLDGVHIGEGCIVGAASLVADDLPPYSVASGVPAVIRRARESRPEDVAVPEP